MAKHEEESPLAGSTVKLSGVDFLVTDWWDRIQGTSWRESVHELAVEYTARRATDNLPDDDNALYGRLLTDDHPLFTEFLVNVCEIVDFQPLP